MDRKTYCHIRAMACLISFDADGPREAQTLLHQLTRANIATLDSNPHGASVTMLGIRGEFAVGERAMLRAWRDAANVEIYHCELVGFDDAEEAA
ncbi:hypothetical protein AQS8620_01327 [Aquimixticola soesokkakensis]|uniref:Uncharacterized protein n=1 Tax=Aquimixticola soesokkakensis TaxID=1519096 RepID=A0A1Y5SCJ5_9RHOB|nr:hypothetical protein [Aquimixticola soesokkakensis]SLN36891.1 hypothetical protein AQS8620_01327 [Aquimixticola soesokkakensis]